MDNIALCLDNFVLICFVSADIGFIFVSYDMVLPIFFGRDAHLFFENVIKEFYVVKTAGNGDVGIGSGCVYKHGASTFNSDFLNHFADGFSGVLTKNSAQIVVVQINHICQLLNGKTGRIVFFDVFAYIVHNV